MQLSVEKIELSRSRGVAPENRVSVLGRQRFQVIARIFVAELERPEHVHMLPRHRRHPLDERDGVQIPGGHLLFVHFGQQRRVVVNDRVRN